jgi:DNA-binding response OmpR family regulator
MRLLLVEDDKALCEILAKRLRRDGYAVDACENGADGLTYALSVSYDGIILDIMLPEIDGLTLLRTLRARGIACGILLLTARDAVNDRVRGLDCGADDYLTKPFAYAELLARLRSMLRRGTSSRSPILRVGLLEMDTVAHTVHRGSRAISLTAKEYALLEYMMRNAGQVLTQQQLYDHVWDYQGGLDSNLVPVYIGYLRAKLDKNETVKYIQTVRGIGYSLQEDTDEA